MKKLSLSIVLICFCSVLCAQDALKYSEVIKIDTIPKDELYNRAKLWFVDVFNSANDVLQLESQQDGQLIGKATFEYVPKMFILSDLSKGMVKYTLQVFIKEGRYKYIVTDFILNSRHNFGLITTSMECPKPKLRDKKWSDKTWIDIKNQIDRQIQPLIISLQSGMNKQSESKNDDW